MEVRLTPDQETFVRVAIEAGRFHDGEGRPITERSMRELAEEVNLRGLARPPRD